MIGDRFTAGWEVRGMSGGGKERCVCKGLRAGRTVRYSYEYEYCASIIPGIIVCTWREEGVSPPPALIIVALLKLESL